jgi:hypothetical protein
MELLGPGEDESRTIKSIFSETYGIQAKIVASDGQMIYEIRIPLSSDSLSRFSLGVATDTLLAMALETSAMDFGRMEGRPGGGMGPPSGGMGGGPGGGMGPPSGGMGGGPMGGMGPGRGQAPGGGNMTAPQQIKIELKIRLASKKE